MSIGVVIPVFEKPFWQVKRAIESATFRQSLMPKEIVIYDDGSNSTYQTQLAHFIDRNFGQKVSKTRLTLILGDYNQGIAVARNRAIAALNSETVALLDADDLLINCALEACLSHLRGEVDFVFSDHYVVEPSGYTWIRKKEYYHHHHIEYWATAADPLIQSTYVVQCQLMRVSAFWDAGGYPDKAYVGEHAWLLPRMAYQRGSPCFAHVPHPLYVHFWSDTGVYVTKRLQLRESVCRAYLDVGKRLGLGLSAVEFLGRFLPFKVSHYLLRAEDGRALRCPYLDYANFVFLV